MAKQYRRGIKVDQDLFGNVMEQEPRTKKGRDAKLIAERDILLYHRYYYFRYLVKLSYEDTYLRLQNRNLFISIDTIPRIIDLYTVELKRMMNANVTREDLKEKYPDFDWSLPAIK